MDEYKERFFLFEDNRPLSVYMAIGKEVVFINFGDRDGIIDVDDSLMSLSELVESNSGCVTEIFEGENNA